MNIIDSSLIDVSDVHKRLFVQKAQSALPFDAADLRTERIAFWEVTPGNRGINHGFGNAILTGLREGAAGDKSYAHDLDVVRARGDHVDKHVVPLGVAGVAGRAGN